MTDAVGEMIDSLSDSRTEALTHIRQLIRQADPAVIEEIKWRKPTNPLGVPTWSCVGIVCTGESYRDKIKLTFMKGALLNDEDGLFNVPSHGVRRAIDLRQSDANDGPALVALIRRAIAVSREKVSSSGAPTK